MESIHRPHSPARSEKTLPVGPGGTRKLKRSCLPLFLFFFYAALVLFSVTTICILSSRPIGATSYGYRFDKGEDDFYFTRRLKVALIRSERFNKAATVIETINTVLAIPVASTICAQAAVVYSQHNRHSLTLGQAIELSDRNWIGSAKYASFVSGAGRRRYGSSFLYLAIAVHLIGKFKNVYSNTGRVAINVEQV
jgi:hypothetical protein